MSRIVVLACLLSSCASAWPSVCTSGLAGVECKCQSIAVRIVPRPGAAAVEAVGAVPAARPGRVLLECDRVALPIVLDGEHIGRGGEP